MAIYKVLQDIEAEDKLVGPLTLRQCIYAAVAAVAGYCSFLVVSEGAAFLVVFFIPFIAFGVFFAFPWTKQQTTEVWALARIRFMVKPRRRIWNQSGVKELVTITAPRRTQRLNASALSQREVQSRLQALAATIDSRGWAVKNVDPAYFTRPTLATQHQAMGTDRLVTPSAGPQEVPGYDTTITTDIFDTDNNPIAQQFDAMMAASANAHRQQIVQQMSQQQQTNGQLPQPVPAAQYWHAAEPPAQAPVQTQTPPTAPTGPVAPPMTTIPVAGDPTPAEQAFAEQLKVHISQPPEAFQHLRTIQPLSAQPVTPPTVPVQTAAAQVADPAIPTTPITDMNLPAPVQPGATAQQQTPVTPGPDPAILELANNNDLSVATIAREAQARSHDHPDEVVVSLH